jgi:hypothetical protein
VALSFPVNLKENLFVGGGKNKFCLDNQIDNLKDNPLVYRIKIHKP